MCYWFSQVGARQYKVGLNPTVLRVYAGMRNGVKGRARVNTEFIYAALAYRDGYASVPAQRAVSMIKKRARP